ncbi:hypothetical protein K431DRAFT_293987 [Polychaeton citri CBS 116435]|uniref:FAD-binding FR-type domain-containing protein n=1 Tax=Polychaeton citri CBS 116435 TaxID=1314669 RepID=A0A9P4QBP5_9PEZI|nr:hypothetical protein K431DRAFT_293987 [Polychaeton citri CBS 116435]
MLAHALPRSASSIRTTLSQRCMATVRDSIPHIERTAAQPRENALEPVILSHIREVNENVRLLRLRAADANHTIKFLPGQWLDTYLPGLPQAGGFTITSTPSEARPSRHSTPFLELAVQRSRNPPAQWLWQPERDILNAQLTVRVGGSFTWPPPSIDVSRVDRLVLVAGGVGINPLVSIFGHLVRSRARPREIRFLYATRSTPELDPQKILFLPRLMDLVAAEADQANVNLSVFLTGTGDEGWIEHGRFPQRTFARRITELDLTRALDGFRDPVYGAEHDRAGTLCMVCGPSQMTDQFVEFLGQQDGMSPDRVLCEKWW